tara:strand:- start:1356 stop:1724 length:369 start_codon:yes stop_codon:yes gene_type:complete
MAKELDLPPAPDKKRESHSLVTGFLKGLKGIGPDAAKELYQILTETGKYAPKPKPRNTKIPHTTSDGIKWEGFSDEFIQEWENAPSTKAKREKKRQRKEKHANKPYKKKSYSNTTRKAKYTD